MPRTRDYRVVGAEYLDSAPTTNTIRQTIPASAAATFACLEDGDAWPQWLDAISNVTWTSPKPFGVGTTRDIRLKPGVVTEHFYGWEDGESMSFYFASGPLPLDAFAEEWRVVATGDKTCEVVWRYGMGLAGPAKVLGPLMAAGFKKTGTKSLATLADFMADNRHKYGDPS